jgi:hypothetical protein
MKNLKKKGALIERVNGCELRAEIKVGEIKWNMYSEKTGSHSIIEPTEKGFKEVRATKRVRAHWDGFILNNA